MNRAETGAVLAVVEPQSVWRWKDQDAIVREEVTIRAFRQRDLNRTIDVEIRLTALVDGVVDTAAIVDGASRWQRFRFVILPFLMPGILSSSILVFAFTFGAFEVPLLLGQRYPSALPVLAYRSYTNVDLNARPEAMAMSVVIAVIISVLVFAYMQLTRRYLRED